MKYLFEFVLMPLSELFPAGISTVFDSWLLIIFWMWNGKNGRGVKEEKD